MLTRCAGLQRAVPSLLRSIHCPPAAAAYRGPSVRRYAVITNVATPEAPQKPKKDDSQQHASFASSAGAAAGVGVPYTQLSVGEWAFSSRGCSPPPALGLATIWRRRRRQDRQ